MDVDRKEMTDSGFTKRLPDDLVRMSWKNGGGMTTEVAKGGQGSGDQNWGWRVSMADVATDGPFSIFSGIDRSIAVIEGDGMDLHYPDGRKTGLDLNKVVNFDGGDAIEGKLRNGAIKDFNVMADRRYFKAILEIASGPIEIEKSTLAGSILLIHILEGSSILSEANQEDRIVETGETVIGEGIIDVTLTLKSAARAAIVTLEATEHKSK